MAREKHASRGQALTEFAIIIVVLLVLLLVIVDAGRIGWAWVTVQSSARAGARYASTGNSGCMIPPDRLSCIISKTHHHLNTLPLSNDPEAPWATDNAYRIEVWGVDEDGNGPWFNNPGAPGKPVAVRAYYWVPIINPLLRPLGNNVKVFGQVATINELFDSMGGASAGVGLPPPLPKLPDPKPTNTPTQTPTNTPTPSPTNTPSPTSTPTPEWCSTHFEQIPVVGDKLMAVTGNLDSPPSTVNIYDLNDEVSPGVPRLIGTGILTGTKEYHDCLGFVDVPLTSPLVADHVIKVENQTDLSWDTEFVRSGTPTPSPSPTASPSSTPSPTPSATPDRPYIELVPYCGFGLDVELIIRGFNWYESASSINFFWMEATKPPKLQAIIPAGHPPDFVQIWKFSNLIDGTHTIEVRSGTTVEVANINFPCENPADLDLVNLSVPNPPAKEGEPFDVEVLIENKGTVAVYRQFFVDVFIDPATVLTDTIPISQSGGYQAVIGLAGGKSKVLTIRIPNGLGSSTDGRHKLWAMADSQHQVEEPDEANNISDAYDLRVFEANPQPTPTPPPVGADLISGVVHFVTEGPSFPQSRAIVWLIRISDGAIMASTSSDHLAYYEFNSVAPDTYEIWACISIDNQPYTGSRSGIVPPKTLVDIFMTEDVAGCPY